MGRVYTKRHLPLQDISMSIPAGQVNGEVILLIPGLRVGPVFSQHAHHIRGASDSCPKKRRGKPHVSKEALAASMAKKNVARARRLARVTGNGGDDDGGGGKSNAAAVDPNSLEARVAARNAEVVKVGDKVMLAPGQADTEVACGVLTEGEIGVVVHLGWTDGMESPCVRGVAGHKWWYKRHQITLAPAARKEKIAGPPPAQPRAPWSPNNFHTSKTTSLE